MRWVAQQVARHHITCRSTLEVGSFDVNGSVRQCFTGPYVGIDMRPGPGVEIVALAALLPFPSETFPVVVCTEMLEHDPAPWATLPELARVLTSGGLLLLTCRSIGFPLHDYPADYWRFTADGVRLLLARARLVPVDVSPDPGPDSPGVLALARKE